MTDLSGVLLGERPIVTFALLAYNQEAYIRKAVEGAFSQTYTPLEIILSDDCSTDKTFDIMAEMARSYVGPHRIIVRQTSENLKPFRHVVDVAALATGDLIILGAGDDISKSIRSDKIVDTWRRTGAFAFHSRYDVIDAEGRVIETSTRSEDLFSSDNIFQRYFLRSDRRVDVVHGATSAYRIDAFRLLPSHLPDGILSEDGVMTIFINAHGKEIEFVDDSLVLYRRHDDALTNFTKKATRFGDVLSVIQKEGRYARNLYERAIFVMSALHQPGMRRSIDENFLRREICIQGVRSAPIGKRVSYLGKAIGIALQDGRLGYILPGIIGEWLSAIAICVKNNLRRL